MIDHEQTLDLLVGITINFVCMNVVYFISKTEHALICGFI